MGTTNVDPRKSGESVFTLIEMLVVISVIAILSSLLLPALGTARNKARLALCGGNMKQVGIAYMIYCDDADGYMPPEFLSATTYTGLWHDLLMAGDYIKLKSMRCPSVMRTGGYSSASGVDYARNTDINHARGLDGSYRLLTRPKYPLSMMILAVEGEANKSGGGITWRFKAQQTSPMDDVGFAHPVARHGGALCPVLWLDGHGDEVKLPNPANPFLSSPFRASIDCKYFIWEWTGN